MVCLAFLFHLFYWPSSPYTSHFIQADSIISGGIQGLDRYAYVNNSPVIYTDPSGHVACRSKEECSEMQTSPNGKGSLGRRGVWLSKLGQKLLDFAISVGMDPEEVIGVGLGHEMFYESEEDQATHEQAFRNGFIQYADANCYGNRTYNCMFNY